MMSPAVPGRAVLESRPDRRAATLPAGNRTAAVSGRTTSGRSRASGRRAVTIPNGQSLVKTGPQPDLGKSPRRVGVTRPAARSSPPSAGQSTRGGWAGRPNRVTRVRHATRSPTRHRSAAKPSRPRSPKSESQGPARPTATVAERGRPARRRGRVRHRPAGPVGHSSSPGMPRCRAKTVLRPPGSRPVATAAAGLS